ncbi:MAG TPA: protein TolR [Xanthomonadaceae bacterium]|nr:protein TolR [Xanthomonadaceae bacterium]
MDVTFKRRRKKLKSEINVVPYIDVMLVLLIIFMVTAPLLNLGVDIELPQSNALPLEQVKDPVVISVDRDGNYYLTLHGSEREAIDGQTLTTKVAAFVRQNPQVPVLVGGDTSVDYGAVYQVMVLMQQAGVPKVGLMSQHAGEDVAR